jgi:hypothetical protein
MNYGSVACGDDFNIGGLCSCLTRQIQARLCRSKDQLRSRELKPEGSLSEATEMFREALVNGVVQERSLRLAALRQTSASRPSLEVAQGKLLLYVPEENLACGGAVYPSKGFFDSDNTPPWDIWIHYSDKTLITWVPALLVPLVNDGIDANPEGCIRWAE